MASRHHGTVSAVKRALVWLGLAPDDGNDPRAATSPRGRVVFLVCYVAAIFGGLSLLRDAADASGTWSVGWRAVAGVCGVVAALVLLFVELARPWLRGRDGSRN